MFCEDFEVYKEAIEENVIANSLDISKNPVLQKELVGFIGAALGVRTSCSQFIILGK